MKEGVESEGGRSEGEKEGEGVREGGVKEGVKSEGGRSEGVKE